MEYIFLYKCFLVFVNYELLFYQCGFKIGHERTEKMFNADAAPMPFSTEVPRFYEAVPQVWLSNSPKS